MERNKSASAENRRTDERPDPDALLKTLNYPPAKNGRGRLKIFFGAAPGVGKTYAMLEAAHRELASGTDVIIGYVEPHQRPETLALFEGLPGIPVRTIDYRGVSLTEFDLQAALDRRPKLILIDELAHTNAPESLNEKRWQDVEHLLAAGIDVYSTLNVQHLESINDVVAQGTGIAVRETVPDAVFDSAWEVELIDLPPDDLLDRLKAGKVYLPEQAAKAREGFFKKGTLVALREMALRRTAERLDKELDSYRKAQPGAGNWAVTDKLLVCVGPSPFSGKLIRATRRMALSLKCGWIAVHVDVVGRSGISSGSREMVLRNLQLAERLGGETAVLTATDMVSELIRFSKERNVSKIIVGKPQQPRWKELLFGSFVYTLTRRCREIDIYVITGDPAKPRSAVRQLREFPLRRNPAIGQYLSAAAIVAFCTGINWLLWHHFNPLNLVMVYLLGVVAVAFRFTRGPAIAAAFLSVLTFDFLFVAPYWTFSVTDSEYLFTFAVMLLTGLTISSLTLRLRSQSDILRERGQRMTKLYRFSREMSDSQSEESMLVSAAGLIEEAVDAKISILTSNEDNSLARTPTSGSQFEINDQLYAVANWAFEHEQAAGSGTSVLSASAARFYPVSVNERRLAVLGVKADPDSPLWEPERIQLLEAFIEVLATALDRVRLTGQAERARLEAETERVRNILLSTVSHDLRTPLAVIEGASSTLLENWPTIEEKTRTSLLETVVNEVEYLNRLVGNLLDVTRLEGGSLVMQLEWQSIEELVGAVTHRLRRTLSGREVKVNLVEDLPLIRADAILLHQVLINLIENADKFSAPGLPIAIDGTVQGGDVILSVSDRGRGIDPADLPFIFDKFFRGRTSGGRIGAGLGLAVCRGIVELHGGTIAAENRDGGGARFTIKLPLEEQPQQVLEATEDEQ